MQNQLCVSNLSFRTSVDDVDHLMSQFGELTECRMILNERKESKGYCFVSYRRREDAVEAIRRLKNYRMEGRVIEISFSQPQR